MDDEDLEYTLLNKREVMVYQIPPASSSAGHKADDWKKCIWRGRLRMAGRGRDLTIKLLDNSSGNLFAQCVIPGGDHASYVERVLDSSRYFVLKITNGDRHAFIGLGFEDRNDAFDFNCTLSDFKTTWVDREKEAAQPVQAAGPAKDLSLKEGQTIKINLPGKSRRREEKAEGGYAGGFGALAPPPPSAPSRRQEPAPAAAPALSPPAAAPVQAAPAATAAADDFFGDFSDFQGGGDPGVAAVSKGIEQLSFGGPAAAPAPVVQASVPDPLGFPAADPFAGPVSAAPAQRPAAAVADPFGGPPQSTSQASRQGMAQAPFAGPPASVPAQAPDPFGGFGGFASAAPAPAKATPPAAARPPQRSNDPFDGLDIFK